MPAGAPGAAAGAGARLAPGPIPLAVPVNAPAPRDLDGAARGAAPGVAAGAARGGRARAAPRRGKPSPAELQKKLEDAGVSGLTHKQFHRVARALSDKPKFRDFFRSEKDPVDASYYRSHFVVDLRNELYRAHPDAKVANYERVAGQQVVTTDQRPGVFGSYVEKGKRARFARVLFAFCFAACS